jgi:hypothetical protein
MCNAMEATNGATFVKIRNIMREMTIVAII